MLLCLCEEVPQCTAIQRLGTTFSETADLSKAASFMNHARTRTLSPSGFKPESKLLQVGSVGDYVQTRAHIQEYLPKPSNSMRQQLPDLKELLQHELNKANSGLRSIQGYIGDIEYIGAILGYWKHGNY